jgi:hypothetical protein
MKRSFRTWFLGVTTLFAMMALAAATLAWFSSNRAVQTNTATARTGDETLELQISNSGGSSFQSVETASVTQVNQTDAGTLLPVSTADLRTFVYAPFIGAGKATAFSVVQNEANYYHGRVYLRAQGEGWPAGSRMNLYLDQSDGLLGQSADGYLLNASRLGLVFGDDTSSPVILRLSEAENPENAQVYNTEVNGKTLGKNQVLGYNGNSVYAASDPSVPVSDYMISFTNNQMTLPGKMLVSMELGKIYAVDVYFYLEGCDPDCSDSVQLNEAGIHLAFYGVLDQKEGN